MDFIRNWIVGLYESAYENMLLRDRINDAMGNGSGAVSRVSEEVINVCTGTLLPVLTSVGLGIAILFFLIQLIELGMSERMTFEYFIKFFTKLVISIALVGNCGQLVNGCIDFGKEFMNLLTQQPRALEYTPEMMAAKVAEALDNTGGVNLIGLIISAVFSIAIINLVTTGIAAIVYVISFTRIMEMGVRGALMPVAMGLMADDGWKGAGGRYIKKFLALCAQGGVLMLIGELSTVAMGAAATAGMANVNDEASLSGSFVMLLGVSIATVTILFKSMGIVNDVFGA